MSGSSDGLIIVQWLFVPTVLGSSLLLFWFGCAFLWWKLLEEHLFPVSLEMLLFLISLICAKALWSLGDYSLLVVG